ncbi:MAG: hypothetical protein ACREEC_04290 [Thermoplasmata archaeon]
MGTDEGAAGEGYDWGEPRNFVPDRRHHKHPLTRVTIVDDRGIRWARHDFPGRAGLPPLVPLTCRICGKHIPTRYWSRICDGDFDAYRRAKKQQYQAQRRARRALERTYRILAANLPKN